MTLVSDVMGPLTACASRSPIINFLKKCGDDPEGKGLQGPSLGQNCPNGIVTPLTPHHSLIKLFYHVSLVSLKSTDIILSWHQKACGNYNCFQDVAFFHQCYII